MTTFILVRHGNTDAIGNRIVGRLPGVHLDETGRAQAEALVERLAAVSIDAIYSSPLERAIETAQPLAANRRLAVQVSIALNEVDFGEWTGMSFGQLAEKPGWERFNRFRCSAASPSGELMLDVQARSVRELERQRSLHPAQTVAVFSHGDVVKLLIAHYAGIAHDLFHRILISTASISILNIDEYDAHILCVNNTGAMLAI